MKNYLLILLSILGMQIFAQEFPIATGSYSQTYPSSAFANGDYYDAFLDKSTGSSSYGFHGKFVSADGTVAPDDIEIVNPTYNLSFMHELIWGQSNYLFAWSRGVSGYDRDAYGRLLGEDGYPLGNFFPVSVGNAESASFVEAAFDGENYLVVWQEGLPNNGAIIRAQFVNQQGQLVGSNFSVRPQSLGSEVSQIYPDVEFDGEKYFVVYDDNRNGNRDIFGQFVSVAGELLGDDVEICTQGADQLLVQLAFGGSNFYAVWADERLSSNDKSIYGQLIGLNGELLGDNLVISPQANSEGRSWPDIAASNGEYLVVWDQEWLEYKAGEDSREGLESLKYEAAGVEMPKPTVWYDIYARKISFQGAYASDEMAICTADYHQQDCDVASDGNDFLVSWSDSRNGNQYYDIYGYIVDGTLMPQLPILSADSIDFTNLNQIFNGGEEFTITNPNDFEISIDDISFISAENRIWYLVENISFPLVMDGGATEALTVNLDIPVSKTIERTFTTDTMLVHSMDSEVLLLLNIDDALLDTIYTYKHEFTQDSIYFQTVEQAINGLTFGMHNVHMPAIYISSVWTSGPYGLWDVSTDYQLPFVIYFNNTLHFEVRTVLPVFPDMQPDEVAVDTLWLASWGNTVYSYPIYFETAVIDSIWTSLPNRVLESGISIYPNPASGFIKIDFGQHEVIQSIEVMDIWGKKKLEMGPVENQQSGKGKQIDISQFRNGIYVLKANTPEGAYLQKFVVKH